MIRRIIVDKNDVIIGSKTRDELNLDEDIYRVSALWLKNTQGQVLIAQRALTLNNGPGLWGPSAAGTVEEDESYEDNVRKEAEEELGVSNLSFRKGAKYFVEGKRKYFCQLFVAAIDKPVAEFNLQANEVASVRWIAAQELRLDVQAHPEQYVPSMEQCLTGLLSETTFGDGI